MQSTTPSSGLEFGGLPAEVADHIIDFLHDDINSLKACALVARSWTPSAHFHIFSTLHIFPDKPGRMVEDIQTWATSDGARVSQYVTALVVRRWLSRWSILIHPKVEVGSLALLMLQLDNVRRITLRNVLIAESPMASPLIYSALRSRTIVRMSVLSCSTPADRSFYPICYLLGLFSAIDQLHFVHTACSWDPLLESAPCFTSLLCGLRIRAIFIGCEDERPHYTGYLGLCRILERADPPWPLQRLGLALPRAPSTPPLSNLLDRYKTTLIELRLNVVPSMLLLVMENAPIPAPVRWHIQALKECTSLESMQLNFLTVSDIRSGDNLDVEARLHAAYNDLLDANVELVLSAPPQLRTLTITFFHIGTWDARTIQAVRGLSAWSRLDDALLRLRRLNSVVCIISMDGGADVEEQIDLLRSLSETSNPLYRMLLSPEANEDEYPGILVKALPRASSAGLLRIVVMS